jgi:hypothetical protein
MTRQALAKATGQPIGPVGTRLAQLAARGLVNVGAELVALPGQQAEPWRPDAEREHERRRQAWLQRGLVVIAPAEANDPFLAERLHCWACSRYGRRGPVRTR